MTTAPPSLPDPATILAPDGPIARRLIAALGEGVYEARPEQAEMSRAVARAMDAQPESRARHLIVEAGTGVGKSFAYLVPAIMRCIALGQRVVIATHTIALQEQLMQKDIPLLVDSIAQWGFPPGMPLVDLKPALVKGRGNYLSIRRLRLASSRQRSLFPDGPARRSLHVIEDWAYSTRDGSLSTLPALEKASIWDRVQSDSGNCMGRRCPTYAECFYQRSRREMEEANLLVCNHAVFFSDLALRAGKAGFLPEYHHVVLDEAHTVEDVASDHFGVSLTEGRVFHLLGALYSPRSGKGFLPHLQLLASGDAPLDGAIRAVQECDAAARSMFDDLSRLLHSGSLRSGRIESPESFANPLSPALRSLALRLKMLKEDAADLQDKFELNAYALRAESIATEAEALTQQTVPGCVYWLEESGSRASEPEHDSEAADDQTGNARIDPFAPAGGTHAATKPRRASGSRVKIACSPVEVGPLLKEHLFDQPISVTLTSATLATAPTSRHARQSTETSEGAFAHVMQRLGVDDSATLQLGSPFDYAKQVELFVEADLPDPRASRAPARGERRSPWDDDDAFSPGLNPLHERIIHHVTATGGGAFVLFTSNAELARAARALRGRLARDGIAIYAQGIDGSRAHILDRFRADPRSTLFGAASFWQGVDVRGHGLRNVIIARLPFEPPDRPLTQARLERIEARGGNPFMEDSLPRAIIRFKQGFGRLIRSRTDTGRVVVLDPRIRTARYGRLFLDSLPRGIRIHDARDNAEPNW